MSFITAYPFRAEIRKTALIGFIAAVPPELFCFIVPPAGNMIYGYFVSDDVIDYFRYEYPVVSLEIIPIDILRNASRSEDHQIWGNRELLG